MKRESGGGSSFLSLPHSRFRIGEMHSRFHVHFSFAPMNAGRLDASQAGDERRIEAAVPEEREGGRVAREGDRRRRLPDAAVERRHRSSSCFRPRPRLLPFAATLLSPPLLGQLEQRHVIVALAFAATAIAYVERVGFAVVAAALAAERRERIGGASGERRRRRRRREREQRLRTTTTRRRRVPSSRPSTGATPPRRSRAGGPRPASGRPRCSRRSFAAWTAATLATPLPGPDCGGGGGGCFVLPSSLLPGPHGRRQGSRRPRPGRDHPGSAHGPGPARAPRPSRPQATAAATAGCTLGAALASALLPALAAGAPSGPRAVLRVSAFLGIAGSQPGGGSGPWRGSSVDRGGGDENEPAVGAAAKPSALLRRGAAGGCRRRPGGRCSAAGQSGRSSPATSRSTTLSTS